MKKIIASILIPALFLQIAGCYSTTEISKYDLQDMKDKEVIKLVTIDSTEYLLQNPPETSNRFPWRMDNRNIYLYSKLMSRQNNKQLAPVDSIIIPLNKIESFSTDIYDSDKTVMWILAIGLVVGIPLIILISLSGGYSFNFNSH